jgi:hypothetical protein
LPDGILSFLPCEVTYIVFPSAEISKPTGYESRGSDNTLRIVFVSTTSRVLAMLHAAKINLPFGEDTMVRAPSPTLALSHPCNTVTAFFSEALRRDIADISVRIGKRCTYPALLTDR